MVSEESVSNLVQEFNKTDRSRTFAEFIAVLFKDQLIEIYLGDSYEEHNLDQISTSYPAVFCGKVVSAYRECLIISSVYVDDAKKIQLGNMMFINERSIRALNQIDGNGIMEDMFLRSRESLDVKKWFADRRG